MTAAVGVPIRGRGDLWARIVLAAGLPIGAVLGFAAASTLPLSLHGVTRVIAVEVLARAAGVVCLALAAPLVIEIAGRYSPGRRVVAALVGLATGVAVTRTLSFLGVTPDALSHVGPTSGTAVLWAAVQEGMTFSLGYGGLIVATLLTLGAADGPASDGPE